MSCGGLALVACSNLAAIAVKRQQLEVEDDLAFRTLSAVRRAAESEA